MFERQSEAQAVSVMPEPFGSKLYARISLIEKKKKLFRAVSVDLKALLDQNPVLKNPEHLEIFKKFIAAHEKFLTNLTDLEGSCNKLFAQSLEEKHDEDDGEHQIQCIKRCHGLLDKCDKKLEAVGRDYSSILKQLQLVQEQQADLGPCLERLEDTLIYANVSTEHSDACLTEMMDAVVLSVNNHETSIEPSSVSKQVKTLFTQFSVKEARKSVEVAEQIFQGNRDKAKEILASIQMDSKNRNLLKQKIFQALEYGNNTLFCQLVAEHAKSLDQVGHIFHGINEDISIDAFMKHGTNLDASKEFVADNSESACFVVDAFCEMIQDKLNDKLEEEKFDVEDDLAVSVMGMLKQVRDPEKNDEPDEKIKSLSRVLISNNFLQLIHVLSNESNDIVFINFLKQLNEVCTQFSALADMSEIDNGARSDVRESLGSIELHNANNPFAEDTLNEFNHQIYLSSFDQTSSSRVLCQAALQLVDCSHAITSGVVLDGEAKEEFVLPCRSLDRSKMQLLAIVSQLRGDLIELDLNSEVFKQFSKDVNTLLQSIKNSFESDVSPEFFSNRVMEIEYLFARLDELSPNRISRFITSNKNDAILWNAFETMTQGIESAGGIENLKKDAKVADEDVAVQHLQTLQYQQRVEKIRKDRENLARMKEEAVTGSATYIDNLTKETATLIMVEKGVSKILLEDNSAEYASWKDLYASIASIHDYGRTLSRTDHASGEQFMNYSRDFMKDLRQHLRVAVRHGNHTAEDLKIFQGAIIAKIENKKAKIGQAHRLPWMNLLAGVGNALMALTVIGAIYMTCTHAWFFKPKQTRRADKLDSTARKIAGLELANVAIVRSTA